VWATIFLFFLFHWRQDVRLRSIWPAQNGNSGPVLHAAINGRIARSIFVDGRRWLRPFGDRVRVCFADFSNLISKCCLPGQGFHTYLYSRSSDAESKSQMRQTALGRILNGNRNHGSQDNVRCLWASRDLQGEWDSQLCCRISSFLMVFLLLKPH